MRLQLSLEMQLYLTLAIIAAIFSFHEFIAAYPSISGRLSEYMAEEFVSGMEGSIMSGNLSFHSYIPAGMCNATVKGSSFATRYGELNGAGKMELDGRPFCPDKTNATIYLAYLANGTVEVSR